MNKYILILIGFVFSLSSCEKLNPDEDIPAYIKVNNITVDAGHNQGTDSVDITTVWIYSDDNLVGAYELPIKAPILEKGNHFLKIRPGIIINGIAGTRSVNPFILDFEKEINIESDSVYEFKPILEYHPQTQFVWNDVGQEGFEDSQGTGISIDSVGGSKTKIKKSSLDVFEGSYSGLISLDENQNIYLGASTKEFDIPGNTMVILEIHVKNTELPLKIGTYANFGNGSVVKSEFLTVNPGSDWKKLFVNLSPQITNIQNADNFKVYFEAETSDEIKQGDIFIDNIKLMHF